MTRSLSRPQSDESQPASNRGDVRSVSRSGFENKPVMLGDLQERHELARYLSQEYLMPPHEAERALSRLTVPDMIMIEIERRSSAIVGHQFDYDPCATLWRR